MTTSKYMLIGLACAALSACGQGKQGDENGSSGTSDTTTTATAPVGTVVSQTTPQAAATPPAAFAVCGSCHAVTPGRNGVGPSLAGIWGRKAGSAPGYAYSSALKTSGIEWNAQTLDTWLQGPIKMVPGTKMVIGLPNPEARKAVIEYIETLK